MWKWLIYTVFIRRVTLKITSKSTKSYQLFPTFQQCIYAVLVKIHSLVQGKAHRNPILDISECWCDLEHQVMVTKIYSTLSLLPTMHICEFGQNPSISSEDKALFKLPTAMVRGWGTLIFTYEGHLESS